MKKLYIILIFSTICSFGHGQLLYYIDFDSPWSENNHITMDTISNPNNIWQIGVPNKPVFDSAYSAINALVTDTLNPYPANDTSSFVLKHIRAAEMGGNESLLLNFWYKFDSDTLTDYGLVEASVDDGATWINLLTEDTYYNLSWLDQKPVLTGSSNGWKQFSLELSSLTYMVGYSDTVFYRFTFISDSIQTNKDGWIIDNFMLADMWEKVEYTDLDDSFISYPNPSNGTVTIKHSYSESDVYVTIVNDLGQVVLKTTLGTKQTIDIGNLQNGVYLIVLENNGRVKTSKIHLLQ